jgi:hypothetical protein
MRLTRFIGLSFALLCASVTLKAQNDIIRQINEYGNFDRWCVREITESNIIGGATKYLYEFYGNPTDTLRTGKEPFVAPKDILGVQTMSWQSSQELSRPTIQFFRKKEETVTAPASKPISRK